MTYATWERDLKRVCIDDDYDAEDTEKILDYYQRFYEKRLDAGEKPSDVVEKLGNPRAAAQRVKRLIDGDGEEHPSAEPSDKKDGPIDYADKPERRGCIYGFVHLIFGIVLIVPLTAVFFLLSFIVSAVNVVFPILGFAFFVLSFFTPLTMLFGVNVWGWLCLMGATLTLAGLMLIVSVVTGKFSSALRRAPLKIFRAYFGIKKKEDENDD